jgi:flavocytochrome c
MRLAHLWSSCFALFVITLVFVMSAAAASGARVVVVGGGLAGLTAAIEAARHGASVIIMEKTSTLGGNSAKATSGMNACVTPHQLSQSIVNDSHDLFAADTIKSAGKSSAMDERLVRRLVEQSAPALEWLQQHTDLSLSTLSQLGGHSRVRTHRLPDDESGRPVPVGWMIMKQLRQKLQKDVADKVTVMTSTRVTSLIADGSPATRVTGVRYRTLAGGTSASESIAASCDAARASSSGVCVEDTAVTADAVILTTGGFGNDHTANSLLAEYAPDLVKVPTTNGAFATGDGVKMAREIGATLQDMDKIQLHPTGFIDPAQPNAATKYLGPEALRGSGGILLGTTGERFYNELGLRSDVSAAIKALGNEYPGSGGLPYAFCVLNRHASQLFGPAQLSFYRDQVKLFRAAPTIADLAKTMIALATGSGATAAGASAVKISEAQLTENLRATLKSYAAATASGRCEKTGKVVFPCKFTGDEKEDGPFVVGVITPAIHYTMGGVAISPAAEVQVVDHADERHGGSQDDGHWESNLSLGAAAADPRALRRRRGHVGRARRQPPRRQLPP